MLTQVEEKIASRILEETNNPCLATVAIVFRRLYPKLQMNAIDLAGHFIHADEDISNLLEEK